MNQYEAMFLFDPTFGSVFADCEAEIRRLLGRADAEIVFLRRWDERRLAYKIKGRKRGVYVLVYFKGKPERIGSLERDAQLSENILRLLVLRADGVTLEMMENMVSSPGATADAAGSKTPEAADAPVGEGEAAAVDSGAQVNEPEPNELGTLVVDVPADEPATEAT
ncbi:MAG: 30S ribosomal protein S6 [Planctomycetota bacterium]